MMKRGLGLLLAVAVLLSFSGVANAALTTIGTATYGGHGYNLIYASDQHLVWLDYTRGYDGWFYQMSWAAGLNTAGVLTYHLNPGISVAWSGDWRLPNTVDGPYVWGHDGTTTAGYNITTSEMGHLYYTELGNKGYSDASGNYQSGWGLYNTSPFTHLVPGYYWSGTEYALSPGGAWGFNFGYGSQDVGFKDGDFYYALAVHSGDVGAPVPIPGALLLFAPGLAGIVALNRRIGRRG